MERRYQPLSNLFVIGQNFVRLSHVSLGPAFLRNEGTDLIGRVGGASKDLSRGTSAGCSPSHTGAAAGTLRGRRVWFRSLRPSHKRLSSRSCYHSLTSG